jgi:hypothetical protein
MSLKHRFASLSLGASVDQQTGNLSIFELVEEIRSPQVPMQLQALVIALVLERKEPGDFQGKILIHLFTPDGKQAMVGSGELRMPAEQRKMRAVFRFGGFPITAFGPHRFVLSWLNSTGAKVGEAILDFEVIQATQIAQGVAPSDKPELAH